MEPSNGKRSDYYIEGLGFSRFFGFLMGLGFMLLVDDLETTGTVTQALQSQEVSRVQGLGLRVSKE